MTKVYIDKENLKNKILIEVEKKQEQLNKIVESLNNIDMPIRDESFNKCVASLNQCKKNLQIVYQWILKSMEQYDNLLLEMNDTVNRINRFEIKKRMSNIRTS